MTRLDMDVEANSLENAAGVDRRNKAIALAEAWAMRNDWPLQIQPAWASSRLLEPYTSWF